MKILIIEDDPNDAELTLVALERAGFANELVHLKNGKEALDFLLSRNNFSGRHDSQPRIVFIDINMPINNGFEVLRTLRSDLTINDIPLILLTTSASVNDMVTGYTLGANAYIVKSINFDNYAEDLRRACVFFSNFPEKKIT